MNQLLQVNPGLLVWVGIFGIATVVLGINGAVMHHFGASLRPVFWFAGFLSLVGVPQFAFHLWTASETLKKEAPRRAAMENLIGAADPETRRTSAKIVFGPDADVDLIVDARKIFGESLGKAQAAVFASLPLGETVLLARFARYTEAEKAWVKYLRETGLNALSGKGDSQRGYAVTRPAGDRAYALHIFNMVGVWTGPDDAAIRRRMEAGGFKTPGRAPLAGLPERVQGESSRAAAPGIAAMSPGMIGLGLAAYLLIVAGYFFKGAAWAGSSPALKNVAPAGASELIGRLEALNALDVPFQVERGPGERTLIATWRFADGKWVDLARARGIRRVHRIKLVLDESQRCARATDYVTSFDWSIGRGGADVEWKSGLGVTFFQYEHQRNFGLQLDPHGAFKPALSYEYKFNLQEMKGPLMAAVTQAGWNWRPVVWQGPKWLRWLTE